MTGRFPWRLAVQLAARDVARRYRGSMGGLAWLVLGPLLLLSIYTLVFGVILQRRWHGVGEGGPGAFALFLFSGMLLHGFLAECLSRAPTLVLGNVNFVKKTPFPLEVLGVSQLLVALAHLLPTFGVLLVAIVVLLLVYAAGFDRRADVLERHMRFAPDGAVEDMAYGPQFGKRRCHVASPCPLREA